VKQCLAVDAKARITPKAAQAHPWLAPLEGEEATASAARAAIVEKLASRKAPRVPYIPEAEEQPNKDGEAGAAPAPSPGPRPAVQEEEEEEDVPEQ
jgi:hypothetical protein